MKHLGNKLGCSTSCNCFFTSRPRLGSWFMHSSKVDAQFDVMRWRSTVVKVTYNFFEMIFGVGSRSVGMYVMTYFAKWRNKQNETESVSSAVGKWVTQRPCKALLLILGIEIISLPLYTTLIKLSVQALANFLRLFQHESTCPIFYVGQWFFTYLFQFIMKTAILRIFTNWNYHFNFSCRYLCWVLILHICSYDCLTNFILVS